METIEMLNWYYNTIALVLGVIATLGILVICLFVPASMFIQAIKMRGEP